MIFGNKTAPSVCFNLNKIYAGTYRYLVGSQLHLLFCAQYILSQNFELNFGQKVWEDIFSWLKPGADQTCGFCMMLSLIEVVEKD